jgi:predicted transcriptional regulator
MKKEISTHLSDNQERCAVVYLDNNNRYEVTYYDRKNGTIVTHYRDSINEAEDIAEDWALNE